MGILEKLGLAKEEDEDNEFLPVPRVTPKKVSPVFAHTMEAREQELRLMKLYNINPIVVNNPFFTDSEDFKEE